MNKVKDILSVLFISALIGMGVGGFFELLNHGQPAKGIINGAISGAIIGFVSHTSFMLLYIRFRQYPLIAFAIVIAIIGAGTFAVCLFWNVPFPLPGMPIILVSELLGISATALLFHNYVRLNKKLQGKIKELSSMEA